MKRLIPIVMIGVVLPCFFQFSTALADSTRKMKMETGEYNPETLYSGPFAPLHLYKRRSPTSLWGKSRTPASLEEVMCNEAVVALRSKGIWIGNINRYGLCGSIAEPCQWTTGNYRNYEESLRTGKTQAQH